MPGAIPRWLAIFLLAIAAGALSAPAQAGQGEVTAAKVYLPEGTPRAAVEKPRALHLQQRDEARASSKACEGGDMAACHALGHAYLMGMGVKQSRPVAEQLFLQACDGGHSQACSALGNLYRIAIGGGAKAEAMPAFDKACALGDEASCVRLAELLYDGEGGSANATRAEDIARRTCGQGQPDACVLLARWLVASDGPEESRAEGFSLLDRYCHAGRLDACSAMLTELDAAEIRDEASLDAYYYLACVAGSATDCNEAGDRAWLGIGSGPDRQFALTMYEQACALDSLSCASATAIRQLPENTARCAAQDRDGCVALGMAHALGGFVLYDPERALELLAPACEAGSLPACEKAADLMHTDLSARRGEFVALNLAVLERSCAGGKSWYCNRLATELSSEDSPVRDMPRAVQIYTEQCRKNDDGACWQLETLAGIAPEAPVAVADERYTAPLSEQDLEAMAEQRREEARRRTARACTETEVRFRGQIYRDRICDNVAYSINGYRIRPGQAPWQALLWRPSQLDGHSLSGSQRVLCGGALIERGWILTAAHCLIDQGRSVFGRDYRIRLGVYNPRSSEGISYPIQRVFPHPDFDPKTYAYDIALVRYDPGRAAKYGTSNSIARITLDPQDVRQRTIADGMDVYAYGWGWTAAADSETTDHLRGVKMQLENPRDCTRITGFTGLRQDAALCAGGAEGQQACTGDSGGALVYYGDRDRVPKVIGVISAGRKCGTRGEPSRYTRVAKVRAWMDGIMRAHSAQ